MIHRIAHRLKTINPWHFLWITILLSEVFGLLFNAIQSYLWWGFLSYDLVLIGVIDCLLLPLLIAPIVIYFIYNASQLEKINKELQLEIIKEKRLAAQKTHETETLYRILFENAPVGIGIADVSGTLIAFNDAMLVPGGYTREDMATIRNVSGLYYTVGERDNALAVFRKQGYLQQFPVQFKRRDGTPYDTLLSLRPITYEGITCTQAMVEDVTERKKMEEALQKNERRYRKLFEDSPIALCEIDISAVKQYVASLEGPATGDMRTYFEQHPEAVRRCAALITVVDMNHAMLDLFRAATKEDLRKNLAHIFHEESYELFREDILMFMTNRKSYEHESVGQTLAGEKVHIFLKWFSASGYDEAWYRVIVSFIDITGLKRAENSLIESREWFRKLVETMNEGLGIQDEKGVITYVNDRFCQMVGYSRDELMGRQLLGFLDETNRKILEEHLARRKKGDKTSYDLRWTKKNGGFIYTVVSPQPLFDETGHYKGSFVTLTDITDRKRAEEERDRVFNLTDDLICVAGADGYFKSLNPAWERLLGYSHEELLSRPFLDFIHPDDHHRNDEEVASLAAGNVTVDFENRYVHKDGSIRTLSWSAIPLPSENIFYCVGRDITKRKEYEELISGYQDQLSLLVSRLSLVEEKERRRIAKDLHDNIGQILACAKLKLGELSKSCDAECSAPLKQIDGLVEQSISYTRSLTSELSVPILYEMGLEPAVAWLGREFQKNHSVQFHMRDDGTSKPLSDDARIILFKAIRELLTNVAKHARAMNVTVSLARKDGSLQVTVGDDGIGFDMASIRKGPRIQTCFGLFSIREALKNSGGSIEIVSAPGRGTRITLTEPLEVTPPNPLLPQEGE